MASVVESGPSGPLYLYGLCLNPAQPPVLPPGIAGRVDLIAVDALAALVEENIDLEAIQADNSRLLEAVVSHDRVLCQIFQHLPLLPLRFGTQLPSRDHLRAYLTQEQATYQAKLLALGDQAEYQVKLIPTPLDLPPLPEGLKGRDYFLAKKQRLQDLALAQQQQQAERHTLLRIITTAYPQAVVDETAADPKVYLLLRRSQQESLAEDLGQWQATAAQWQIQMSEALPPYHFV
ncbi:MAG: GvpL/GvpF family gas vesicle protein [Leptolyngbya sp.]|nr:GvpL/GvpF family gas vesicle protein [Leptolyngbya sp.]